MPWWWPGWAFWTAQYGSMGLRWHLYTVAHRKSMNLPVEVWQYSVPFWPALAFYAVGVLSFVPSLVKDFSFENWAGAAFCAMMAWLLWDDRKKRTVGLRASTLMRMRRLRSEAWRGYRPVR